MPTAHRVDEISAPELARMTESAEPVQILDIRSPGRVAAASIRVSDPTRFIAIPGSRLTSGGDPESAGLDRGRPTVVVCDHGVSSRPVTKWLGRHGYEARSLKGGMAAWMNTLVARRLSPPDGFDLLVQFDRLGKGSLSYLLASQGEAVFIDPPARSAAMLEEVEREGLRLAAVLDTHLHADFISGSSSLSRKLGVPYLLHPSENVYPYDGTPGRLTIEPATEGTEFTIAGAALRALHTPGHTEGSLTWQTEGAAFTGDFLFVGSVGRPDLGGRTEEWAHDLWQSLDRARSEWPDDLLVLPGHYSTEEERAADRSVSAPFGRLKSENGPLGIASLQEFLDWIDGRDEGFPEAYRYIKAVNLGLMDAEPRMAEELEFGRNECAA